jgi:MarR family transcriptional regulator, organic hydroperoxide resistance regulator
MIGRLAAQDYVERRASKGDGRQAEVHLTERGRRAIDSIDKVWKRIEKTALDGIDDKDRKRLRKLLRQIERNLGGKRPDSAHDADDETDSIEETATA